MKSILHLKDDTEYQIPLREGDEETDRAKVDVATANPVVNAEKEDEKKVDDKKKVNDEVEATATQSQDDIDATEVYEEDLDETQNHSNTENSSDTTTESTTTENVPPADTAKAALDEMKKLASQGGVIHPSLFISNFSKILGLMERAMQLQVKESGSATKESGSVTKEEASKANEQAEVPEKTEIPAEGNQGELNGNTNNNRS